MDQNYPAPRVIPPGKILRAECGEPDVKANRCHLELVEEAPAHADMPGRRSIAGNIRLEWCSPGWDIAGSCMIWINGYWACRFWLYDGTRHGQRYAPDEAGEEKARAHFRKLTTNSA